MRENETIQNTPLIRKIKQFWIPEGWNKLKMKDLFNFFSGISLSRNQLSEEGIPCLHYGDIHNSSRNAIDINIEGNSLGKTDGKLARKSAFLSDGDVVFVDASEDYEGTNRYVVVSNKQGAPFLAGLHTIVSRKKSRDLLNSYLKYCFETPRINRQFRFYVTGISVYGISKHNLGKIVVPVPPTKEQGAIAEILSTCDRVIELKKKLVGEKKKVKKWLMQTLLTGMICVKDIENGTPFEELKKRIEQIRNGQIPEGYEKKRNVGIFPVDWELQRLVKYADKVVDGTHTTPKYVENGVPFYSVETITSNDFKNVKFISHEEHLRLSKRCKVEKGDILLTRIGTIGKTALVDWDEEGSIYVSLALIKISNENLRSYFYEYSKSSLFVKEVLRQSLLLATPPKINMNDIEKVKLVISSSGVERTRIAEILSTADKEIDLLNKDLKQWELKKKSLMQLLLTGIVRVSTEN